jgi:hypothetical protein
MDANMLGVSVRPEPERKDRGTCNAGTCTSELTKKNCTRGAVLGRRFRPHERAGRYQSRDVSSPISQLGVAHDRY